MARTREDLDVWAGGSAVQATALRQPLTELRVPPRVVAACAAAGAHSVAEALGLARADILRQRGLGARSWQALREGMTAFLAGHGAAADGRRDGVASGWVSDPRTSRALARLGMLDAATLARPEAAVVLLELPGMDEQVVDCLQAAASSWVAEQERRVEPEVPAVLVGLPPEQRDALYRAVMQPRAGINVRAAGAAGDDADLVQAALDRLRRDPPPALRRAAAMAEVELERSEGAVVDRHLRRGSPLLSGSGSGRERSLPLRVLAAVHADRWCWDDGTLLAWPLPLLCRAVRVMDRLIPRSLLPAALADVRELLGGELGRPLPHGVMVHLLSLSRRLQLVFDPEHGEVVRSCRAPREDRIERLLRRHGTSMATSDLLFAYRERYGRSRRGNLLDTLHRHPRFVRIDRDLWDLRERHVDMLELLQHEAARLRDLIVTAGERHDLTQLLDLPETSNLVVWLLRDLMARDPGLRALGRGVFRPARMPTSTQLQALRAALTKAGGELPLRRFLVNQPPRVRSLRARLLQRNRAFVEVREDRIDLLDNYPLTPERLRQVLYAVELHLESRDGWDRLEAVEEVVRETALIGPFLSRHLLRDVLRRHGNFDLLPDDLVLQRSRPVLATVSHRAREVIRRAGRALTASQIVAESPDLAPFAAAIDTLFANDPIIQSPDGLHWAVV